MQNVPALSVVHMSYPDEQVGCVVCVERRRSSDAFGKTCDAVVVGVARSQRLTHPALRLRHQTALYEEIFQ